MNVERTDFVSVFTQDICWMASSQDPDGNALPLQRRFDA